MISTIGNFLWFILGGFFMGLTWWVIGLLAYLSIIGIPWGKACFVMGQFTFFPFGKEAVNRVSFQGNYDIGTGFAGSIGNLIWFVFAGYLAGNCPRHLCIGMFCDDYRHPLWDTAF